MKPMHAISTQMPMNVTRPATKAAQSVGHQAKSAVAAAWQGSDGQPKNAQGLAASAIARGIDPASLFAAMTSPPADQPEAGETEAPSEAPTEAPMDETGEASAVSDPEVPPEGTAEPDA